MLLNLFLNMALTGIKAILNIEYRLSHLGNKAFKAGAWFCSGFSLKYTTRALSSSPLMCQ